MKRKLIFLAALIVITFKASAQTKFKSLTTPTNQALSGISFYDSSIGYACGNAGTILKTINGGKSWVLLSSGTTQNLWDIEVIPNSFGQKIVAVGVNNTIIKSINGGNNWMLQTIPFQSGSFVFGIQCLDSLTYFASGGDYATFSGSILKTIDGGATWTKTAVTNSVFLDKVFMLNKTVGFTVGTNKSFTDGAIHNIDNGNVFSVSKVTSNVITNLWCNSPTNIITVGLTGQIWKSVDGGKTWTNQSISTVDLYGIQFKDSLNGYACGGSNVESVIIHTSDGGLTWSQIPFNFKGSFKSLSVLGNTVFIAGDSGKIITSSISSSSNISKIESIVEIPFHPNPFALSTSIKFSKAMQNASFVLYDITGNEMKRIDGIYLNEIQISRDNLPSGLYYYNLLQNNKIVSKGNLTIVDDFK